MFGYCYNFIFFRTILFFRSFSIISFHLLLLISPFFILRFTMAYIINRFLSSTRHPLLRRTLHLFLLYPFHSGSSLCLLFIILCFTMACIIHLFHLLLDIFCSGLPFIFFSSSLFALALTLLIHRPWLPPASQLFSFSVYRPFAPP